MTNRFHRGTQRVANRHWLVEAAVAAAIAGSFASPGLAAQAPASSGTTAKKEEAQLEEVQVTGSRIVRRDLESNSPLTTVDKEKLEDNTFISVEEALNDLPQFMVGGVNNSSASVTSLQSANALDGGRGSGDAFNGSLLDPAGTIGQVVPGAANVNLRGLGANRSLTLIDGHRGMPSNASMTVDLNTIPTVAIGNIEVITGGASAVYGADALAGVTNIKLRDNFEGLSVRVRSGVNEVGDGEEYQVSALMGSKMAEGRGSAMMGVEYSRREVATWGNRSFFREVLESPLSGSGDMLFPWDAYYSPGAAGSSNNFAVVQNFAQGLRVYSGNAPTVAAVNAVFSNRNCYNGTTQLSCIVTGTNEASLVPIGGPALGSGFHFNSDGTLFTRGSSVTTNGVTTYYGPQNYKGTGNGTKESPNEIACPFQLGAVSAYAPFAGKQCQPTASNRADYGRWLSSPREAYTLFGRGSYKWDNNIEVFSNFNFASSKTFTRREPSPALGPGFNAIIPFGQSEVYLPSLIVTPQAGQVAGNTRPEYLPGGSKGTSCAPVGGCTMAQAFPVSTDLRTLLESRPNVVIPLTSTSPFRGLSACQDYNLVPLAQIGSNPAAQTTTTPNVFYPGTTTPIRYTVAIDPNTGLPVSKCGVRSGWQLNQQLKFLPVRGTNNTSQIYQLAAGLRGDLHLADWTWELYLSQGEAKTNTEYNGFTSLANYLKILSAPNYGQGYSETGQASKFFTCTSGLNPFNPNLVVSPDCIEAVSSNQIDRNTMTQRIYELTTQGRVADLPAGEMRASVGASYRKNDYQFTPDSLREASYTGDANSGAFAQGSIDESVTAKEYFGELLVPLLNDLPAIRKLELELGARHSEYSTGQKVNTYKALASWEPLQWLRARGGYNRAERAPNMSELYATPTGSSQFAAAATDPCRANSALGTIVPADKANTATNPNRTQLQALCSAMINFWGGNSASDFHVNPGTWDVAGGIALIVGNKDLKNEKGDTWTAGLAMSSPFQHPLLSRITATVDWYEARVSDPIEVQATSAVVNSCFNVNGANPTYSLNDPGGYCSLIERNPSTGAIERVYNTYGNQGKVVIRGLDFTLRWTATMSDLGLESVPGTVSVDTSGNYIMDQIQRYVGSTDRTADYAGFSGASRLRAVTNLGYRWGNGNRVALQWTYRQGTQTPTTFTTTASAIGTTGPVIKRNAMFAGYHSNNFFALTGGTRLGPVNASLTVNNLLNTKPGRGGYDFRDPNQGFGSFSPFDDLVGRRYSINLSMDF